MKFELKTENENYSKSFSYFLGLILIFSLTIILCDVAIKLGIISRHYQIEYNCRLLSVEKSTTNFKKLSNFFLTVKPLGFPFMKSIINWAY